MKFDHFLRIVLILTGVSLAAAVSGCAGTSAVRVQPWQHGELAGYIMQPGRDPLASAMSEHVYFAREAATGGRGVGGSGCGCN